ncbi:MAG: hypothetical protein DWP95_11570 [Proteobacteria bacterium]|nr:MAG: hypothetical protein DWP95_11570 [Pseudomonadota bacterium]
MSNTYTLRADSEQSNDVSELMEYYQVGHATKALFRAAKDVPVMKKQIDKLVDENNRLSVALERLMCLVKNRQSAEQAIADFLQDNE